MSISYWGTVIVGIPLQDIYSYEIKVEKKTRYNQDTGEPYFVNVKKLYGKFGNKELPAIEEKFSNAFYGGSKSEGFFLNWEFLFPSGIGVFHRQCYRGDPSLILLGGILGIDICNGDKDVGKGVDLIKVSEAFEKMKKFLEPYGLHEKIKLYCQIDAG
jgi:hypothetical protein